MQSVECPALVIGDAGPKMRNGTRQQMPMEIGSLVSFVTYARRGGGLQFIMILPVRMLIYLVKHPK